MTVLWTSYEYPWTSIFFVETSILCVDFYKIMIVTVTMDKATKLAGGVAVSNFGFKFSQSGNLWNVPEFVSSVVNMQLSVKEGSKVCLKTNIR